MLHKSLNLPRRRPIIMMITLMMTNQTINFRMITIKVTKGDTLIIKTMVKIARWISKTMMRTLNKIIVVV